MQGTKIGIQVGLNNDENSLANVTENSRCRSWQVNPDLVTQQFHQGAGIFVLFFYSAIYWVNLILCLCRKWQPVAPQTAYFLSPIWQGRETVFS